MPKTGWTPEQRAAAADRMRKLWTPERRARMREINIAKGNVRNPLGTVKLVKLGSRTYRLIKVGPDGSDGNGWALEHRLIMEKHLGRELDALEHVHHINDDPLDNRIENLQVLHARDHASHHHKGVPERGPNARIEGRWSRHFLACIKCGTSQKRHASQGLCVNCAGRLYDAKRRLNKALSSEIR